MVCDYITYAREDFTAWDADWETEDLLWDNHHQI